MQTQYQTQARMNTTQQSAQVLNRKVDELSESNAYQVREPGP